MRIVSGAGVLALASLTGCATQPQTIYHWGNYQPAVWSHFKPNETGPLAQQAQMEKTQAESQSKGKPLPPGFQAHLGLLYLQNGDPGKAQLAFQSEQTQFPESKTFMDFLLKDFKPQATPAVPVAPPAAPAPDPTAPPPAAEVSATPTAAPVAGSTP